VLDLAFPRRVTQTRQAFGRMGNLIPTAWSVSWTGIESKATGSNSKAEPRKKWGRLTDDELDVINGRREQLEGKIQERYGLAKDQAKQDVDAWSNSLTNIT
jgi:uncharacterized protein YjbJ (UPF0337 family)